jgi:hypothetical protein
MDAEMEPALQTDRRLLPTLAELVEREPLFHRRELISNRADFEFETAAEYWEVGASGRRYGRDFVWAVLEQRIASAAPDEWESGHWRISDRQLREIAPRTYLLTYTLDQDGRLTRRLTVWQGAPGGWKALFHQGTIVEPSAADQQQ